MFLDGFGAYDYLVRDSLILTLVIASVYVLLNAGIFALPQVGFMAVGAYTSGILFRDLGWPLWSALPAAALIGGLLGAVLAILLARLNGIYLAMATIAFGEMVRVVARNLDFTGGPNGIVGIERSANDVWIVASVAVVFVLLTFLARSRHGLAARAMREDVLSAEHQGIDVRVYRVGLFALSGALAATGGALQVRMTGYLEPGNFSFDLLTTVLAAAVVGGMVSVWGPLVGAVVVFGLPEALRGLEDYRTVVNGVLIVLIIAFVPRGLASLIAPVTTWLRTAAARPGPTPVEVVHHGNVDVLEEAAQNDEVGGGERILVVDDARLSFGGIRALDGVSFDVARAEVMGIIGPNGSGKTTVLNVLSGAYVAEAGDAHLGGVSLAARWGRPDRIAALGLSRTFQTIRLIAEASVFDNVLVGSHRHRPRGLLIPVLEARARQRDREARRLARELLTELGLDDVADRAAGTLPYGMQRRVEIARALASRPSLLLLDEPTAGMTPDERRSIFELIQQVRTIGITVVVVEHDVESMRTHCDRLLVLNFGKVIASGLADDIMRREEVIHAYIGQPA